MGATFDLTPEDTARVAEIKAMKRKALAVLIFTTALFIVARVLETDGDVWSYVRATAEAAMVGGIADWFAVTALFRHPLGIPIPHTAILPNRKDQLGETLGSFVQTSFLNPELVAERVAEAGVSNRIAEWLGEDANVALVAEKAGSVAATVVRLLDDQEVSDLVTSEVMSRLRSVDLAPVAAKVVEVATADGRHHQLVDAALNGVSQMMSEQRPMLRDRFAAESPWWVPESVDEKVFERIYAGLSTFINEVRTNPQHPLRKHVDTRLAALITELRTDPAMSERLAATRDDLLTDPNVREWSKRLWVELREQVIESASRENSELHQRLQQAVRSLRHALVSDPELQQRVDRAAVDIAGTMAARYGDEIAGFVSSTVQRWDATETSLRVELLLGRDLQIIRINGSVVGGLAGLVIYTISQLFA
jgi:uncharacterized membrane-anchored protein YjiN (DUF445 family)